MAAATGKFPPPAEICKNAAEKYLRQRKILPRRVTGTCAMHQRQLTLAIKNARIVALLPYITD